MFPLRVKSDRVEKRFTPPLRGSRRAEGVSPKAIRWGDMPQKNLPPPHQPSHKPLGFCDSPSRGELILFCGGCFFFTPLTRGGRGGCLCPLTRRAFSTTPAIGLTNFLNRAATGACPYGPTRSGITTSPSGAPWRPCPASGAGRGTARPWRRRSRWRWPPPSARSPARRRPSPRTGRSSRRPPR